MKTSNCRWCQRTIVHSATPPDGMARHKGKGLCTNCYSTYRRNRPLPPKQVDPLTEKIITEYLSGLTMREVAEMLGISQSKVARRIRAAGLTRPRGPVNRTTYRDEEVALRGGAWVVDKRRRIQVWTSTVDADTPRMPSEETP